MSETDFPNINEVYQMSEYDPIARKPESKWGVVAQSLYGLVSLYPRVETCETFFCNFLEDGSDLNGDDISWTKKLVMNVLSNAQGALLDLRRFEVITGKSSQEETVEDKTQDDTSGQTEDEVLLTAAFLTCVETIMSRISLLEDERFYALFQSSRDRKYPRPESEIPAGYIEGWLIDIERESSEALKKLDAWKRISRT